MKPNKNNLLVGAFCLLIACATLSFRHQSNNAYVELYQSRLQELEYRLKDLQDAIPNEFNDQASKEKLRSNIASARRALKACDIWLRYLEPVNYKKINGPLPVEWETEVFEKFEKPYRREGAGLTLAELYLDEDDPHVDSLRALITSAIKACKVFHEDSVTSHLSNPGNMYFSNRLFLLNLATIYSTGFECPNTERIIPELRHLIEDALVCYHAYNVSNPSTAINDSYLSLFHMMQGFVDSQPEDYTAFDHFTFIREYVNPLFNMNQTAITNMKFRSMSYQDYTLNTAAASIFSKNLYHAQSTKGVFQRVRDPLVLDQIRSLGYNLFFDPILSGNNERSCASCHKPSQCFTDTAVATALAFDRRTSLPRNAPTLVNAPYNHLIMADGAHLTLQDQALGVMTNTLEMACASNDLLKKVLSCKDYRSQLKKLLKHTPQLQEIEVSHISSALTYYYGDFSRSYSDFDAAMNNGKSLSADVKQGFNLFMSKTQCATCHFAPQFNGVKPPYLGSEFEVIGVPADKKFSKLSPDDGRYKLNPSVETKNAFRTTGLRNIALTKPYMHNGVFSTLEEVIDFYDAGGAVGHGLALSNQTLSSDSLHLTDHEKRCLKKFLESLNEQLPAEQIPTELPKSTIKALNARKPGGMY